MNTKSTQVERAPLRGALFENMVVMDLLKERLNGGEEAPLFLSRDSHGHEVDVVLKQGRTIIPMEIRSAETFHAEYRKNIDYFRSLSPGQRAKNILIYTDLEERDTDTYRLVNFRQFKPITES